ncbi:MAG: hypothetical protein Q8N99_08440 [Nanoarchaeota archaeon]|nr:hypothetical protein [Nanoarchaeota archaeon]
MKYNKKAQSEIITTVLIILLVLAAIVIVWQVVQGTIGKAKTGIGEKTDCLDAILSVSSAKASGAANNVIIKRESGASTSPPVLTGIKVYKKGVGDISSNCGGAGTPSVIGGDITVGNTKPVTCTGIAAGDDISVAGVIGNSVCSESPTTRASA